MRFVQRAGSSTRQSLAPEQAGGGAAPGELSVDDVLALAV